MKDHERAAQVWAVLAWAAHNRQVITYEILSQLTGVPQQGFALILDHIQCLCDQRGLPPLTSIVVNKESGVPGEGFRGGEDIPRIQQAVFSYDWLREKAPTAEDLEAAR